MAYSRKVKEPKSNIVKKIVIEYGESKANKNLTKSGRVFMNINQLLQDVSATNGSTWYLFLLAFLAGVLVSFTPCMYPMIPITAGILQTQASSSFVYNFLNALTYVAGISVVYASLGYLSATSAMLFGKWVASPWFIAIMIVFFLYLAFSMFGFYEIHIPSFLSNRTDVNGKKSLFHSFLFGMLSGTVASPCLTPALALLLGIVAQQGNPLVGFFTLFCFSLGMGILLLLIGTFSGTLSMLPHAGGWMEQFKKLFGFLMLGVCLYFLQPFLSPFILYAGYTLLATVSSVYYLKYARGSTLCLILGILSLLLTLACGVITSMALT